MGLEQGTSCSVFPESFPSLAEADSGPGALKEPLALPPLEWGPRVVSCREAWGEGCQDRPKEFLAAQREKRDPGLSDGMGD